MLRILPRVSRWSVVSARNVCLLVASYTFYAAWDYRFLALLFASTANDFFVGRALMKETRPGRRRSYIGLSLAGNLGLLAFFKYFDFFTDSMVQLLGALGVHAHAPALRVVLPVGISFYTFQSLSYTLDVYRGHLRAETNPLSFATFVAFFPQLVAGPIERPERLLPQFRHTRPVTWSKLSSGAYLIAVGLFKKVVIADIVARVADAGFRLHHPTRIQAAAAIYAFAFQIYADFSAYSDIARGTARCLGFELSRNFDMPYLAASPSEFWRRWHISLSTWLRDYLYISLGGNRFGRLITYRNLLLTMVLGGLWHGASWTFVLWGAFHGALLCLYRPFESRARAFAQTLSPLGRAAARAVAVVCFFQLVCLAWVFFRADTVGEAFDMLHALAAVPSSHPLKDLAELGPFWISACLVAGLVGVQLLQYRKQDSWLVFHAPIPVRGVVYAVGFLLFVWIGQNGSATFIYFQF